MSSAIGRRVRRDGERWIVGCMTGTSMDALDLALIKVEGSGLAMEVKIESCASHKLGRLTDQLRRVAAGVPASAAAFSQMAYELALHHLDAIRSLARGVRLDLVSIHGQTIFHQPPLSWQIINPAPVAYGLGVPVVYNLRAADLALGGQGAPITPLADFILFRKNGERRCIVNLGGYCNITRLPSQPSAEGCEDPFIGWVVGITGKDVCACNNLLDEIARRCFNLEYDDGGCEALQGTIQTSAYNELTALLARQASSGRSLGTGDELSEWLQRWQPKYSGRDLARTACAAIATTITRPGPVDRVILAGGGVKNRSLVQEILSRSRRPVGISDEFGVPAQMREAAAMGVLGGLCQDRIPITLSQVTGIVDPPVAGSWVLP